MAFKVTSIAFILFNAGCSLSKLETGSSSGLRSDYSIGNEVGTSADQLRVIAFQYLLKNAACVTSIDYVTEGNSTDLVPLRSALAIMPCKNLVDSGEVDFSGPQIIHRGNGGHVGVCGVSGPLQSGTGQYMTCTLRFSTGAEINRRWLLVFEKTIEGWRVVKLNELNNIIYNNAGSN